MSQEQAEPTRPSDKWTARRFFLPILLIAALGSAAVIFRGGSQGGDSPPAYSDAEAKSGPARLEPIGDSGLNRVILSERAAQRLDIQTTGVVEEPVNGTPRLIVPYAALIYGLYGETWVYVSPEPLTYFRQPVNVEYIDGDLAVLVDGPPAGTEVVSVGVAELYGTDTGVGK